MLQPVINKLIAEAESKMPTISADLESDNYAKAGGWGGILLGAATGAKVGAGLGIAGGPLGAIAGTIPGAVVGAVVGYFSGERLGKRFEVEENDGPDSSAPPSETGGVCPKCGHNLRTPIAKQCRHCGSDWH